MILFSKSFKMGDLKMSAVESTTDMDVFKRLEEEKAPQVFNMNILFDDI